MCRWNEFPATLTLMLVVASTSALAGEPILPGNASSVTEAHGNWTVTCAIVQGEKGRKVKRCALSQHQILKETRQKALAIELRPERDHAKGALVLPFGLMLQAGVTYQLDDRPIGGIQHFRTCLPDGCIVDIDFDEAAVATLKMGRAFNVNATADGGQEVTFSISLEGFSRAYDRVVELLE